MIGKRNQNSPTRQMLRSSWYYVIVLLFLFAVIITFVDSFIHSIKIIPHVFWTLAFASYLLSEKIEDRRILPSEKAFAYSFVSLFGFYMVDDLSKANQLRNCGLLILLTYTLFVIPWLFYSAIRLWKQAPDRIGAIKVWVYTILIGGTIGAIAISEFMRR